VLVPTRPGQADIPAVTAARRLDYPAARLEIIVVRGKQPSVQRNAGLRAARGEIIYFLDDDSVAAPANLQRALEHFQDPAVKIVGGPNLCPTDAPFIEQVFALVLASWLAFGPSRARYAPVGVVRESGEKELILCNLLARRQDLLELGGFNEALYPNEENALMDELQKRGGKLIYDPQISVHRRPRPNLKSFCRMLMTYGRGRAEQFRVLPTLGSAPNFVPPLFCVYLVTFWLLGWIGLLPLGLYGLVVLAQTVVLIPRGGLARSLAASPLLVLSHIFYGLGFWRGLFTKLNAAATRAATHVELERVEPGGASL
jgi:glycosyltransferase involved in cell wall biosynthesis